MTTYFPTDYDAINEIGRKAGESIAEKATKLYDSLTTDERQRFSRNGEFPYRLAKLLIVACQDESIRNRDRFQLENACATIGKAIRKAKGKR
jgi:hypothetical protein